MSHASDKTDKNLRYCVYCKFIELFTWLENLNNFKHQNSFKYVYETIYKKFGHICILYEVAYKH